MKNKLYVLLLFTLASCQVDTESFLTEASWSIHEITFDGQNVKSDFAINLLSLKEDNVCIVPSLHNVEMSKRDLFGKWSFNKNTKKLTIESKNPYLNGVFDVCFEKNTEYKRIILVLTSDRVRLKASKGISQYRGKGSILPISCDK